MSQTIDSKVVEMKFDNSNFEANVSNSLSTLDKLKAALKFDGATDGLEKVDQAAQKVDMNGLGDAVDQVGVKFSSLQIVATTALANITNSAVNCAKSMLNSVVSAVGEGGLTRALNLEQAQFMFEGLGMDVDAAMQSCNDAVTDTAYSLDQAAMAAAQFGASGMKAGDDMTSALRGIAGVAAMTGSEYSDIASIFTTVAGNGRLMSEQLLQFSYRGINAAAALAEQLGVTEAEVREMVTAGEIDFETFYKAMDNAFGQHAKDANQTFTGALSNMKAAAARIGADFYTPVLESTRDLINSFTPIINDIKTGLDPAIWALTDSIDVLFDKLENLLATMDVGGFFDRLYDTFSPNNTGALKMLQDEQIDLDTFYKMSSKSSEIAASDSAKLADTLTGLQSALHLLGGAFNVAGNAASGLYRLFSPMILSITGGIGKVITSIDAFMTKWDMFGHISDLVTDIFTGDGGLVDAFSSIGEALSGKFNFVDGIMRAFSDLNSYMSTLDLDSMFSSFGEKVKSVITSVSDAIVAIINLIPDNFGSSLVEGISGLLGNITTGVGNFLGSLDIHPLELFNSALEALKNLLGGVKDWLSGIGDSFSKAFSSTGSGTFFDLIKTLGSGVGKAITSVLKGIGDAFSWITDKLLNADFSGVIDLLNSFSFAGLTSAIASVTTMLSDPKTFGVNMGKGLMSGLVTPLNSLKVALQQLSGSVNARMIEQIAIAVGILAASMYGLSKIDSDKLGGSIAGMGALLGELVAAMEGLKLVNFTGSSKNIMSLIELALAVNILAGACRKLGELDFDQLCKGLVGVGALLAGVYEFMNASGKNGGLSAGTIKSATSMILMAEAINILASVAKKLSDLNWDELGRGLVGVEALLLSLDGFLKLGSFNGKGMISTGLGIIEIAAAMKILASACADFGEMNWEDLGKGLVGIEAILGGLTAFTKFGGGKGMVSTGLGIIEIGAAMKIFADACSDFALMDWTEMAQGLIGMGVALAAVDVAMNNMYGSLGDAASFVIVAAALEILADVTARLGGMDLNNLAQGLIAMGVALAEVTAAMNLMKGTSGASASLLLASSALTVLCIPLKILGGMSLEEIGKSLIAVAGSFTVIGVAAKLLSGTTGAILALSTALLVLGAATLAIGGGLTLLGVGLDSIAASGTVAAEALALVITTTLTSAIKLLPTLATELAQSIILFIQTLGEGVGTIGESLKNIILTACDVIGECAPEIARTILDLLVEAINMLSDYGSQIVDSLITFLINVIDTVASRIGDLGESISGLVTAIFDEIGKAFTSMTTSDFESLILTVGSIAGLVVACNALKAMLPGAMVGLAELTVFTGELTIALAALGAINQIPGLDWLVSEGGNLLANVGTAIGQFVGSIVGGALEGISSGFPGIATNLSDFMTNLQPFLNGASSIDSGVGESISSLCKAILMLTAADIIDGITKFITGGSSLSEFGNELADFGPSLQKFGASISGIDVDSIKTAAEATEAMVGVADKIPNEGGLLAKITGDNSLAAFGKELASFAPSLVSFASQVQGITGDTVAGSVDAIAALVGIADKIPNSGGALSFFTGDNDFGTFGASLAALAPGLRTYANSVTGITGESVSGSVDAIEQLCRLSDMDFPDFSTGALGSFITGNTNISAFADSLKILGDGLAGFSSSNFDAGKISSASSALTVLNSALKTIDGSSTSNIQNFKKSLDELSKISIDGFVKSISGAGPKITAAVNSLISAFSSGFDSSKIASTISSSVNSGVSSAVSSISSNTKSFQSAGQSMMTSLIAGISAENSKCVTAVTTILKAALTAIKSQENAFQTAGKTLITKLASGVTSGKSSVTSAAKSVASSGASAVRGYYSNWRSAGGYLVSGFANGIRSNASLARSAAASVARSATSSLNTNLKINSPSKITMKSGASFDEGFATGIIRNVSMVTSAVGEVATLATKGLSKAVAKMADAIDSDIDINPTITPVLDLTNVESGAGRINTLLSGNGALGLAMNSANWISGSMNSREDPNAELISAIKKLGRDITNEPRSVTNNTVNGVSYDDGSAVQGAIETLVHAAKVGGRT